MASRPISRPSHPLALAPASMVMRAGLGTKYAARRLSGRSPVNTRFGADNVAPLRAACEQAGQGCEPIALFAGISYSPRSSRRACRQLPSCRKVWLLKARMRVYRASGELLVPPAHQSVDFTVGLLQVLSLLAQSCPDGDRGTSRVRC